MIDTAAIVIGVSRSGKHTVQKAAADTIVLRAGFGVEEDAHAGATVQHRYTKRYHPDRPNERQIHLIGAELLDDLARSGYRVDPGQLGENVTTRGIALMDLALGTRLHIGREAIVEVRGLREPCSLIDRIQPGLRDAVSVALAGDIALKHGVMGIVIAGGVVCAGDAICVVEPTDAPPLPFV